MEIKDIKKTIKVTSHYSTNGSDIRIASVRLSINYEMDAFGIETDPEFHSFTSSDAIHDPEYVLSVCECIKEAIKVAKKELTIL
jgi:hypothetical protein